jgi:uncharacterized protein (DUF58 family)
MPRLRLPRRFPPTREGWWFLLATLLVGAAAINGGINLLFFVFGMMIFLILASGVLSELCLRGLEVTRRPPGSIHAGSPYLMGIAVRNQKRRLPTFSLEVEDLVAGRPVDRRCYYLKLPAGRVQETAYRNVLTRRGYHELTGFRLSTRFPFGLIRKSRDIEAPARLLVYPTLVPVPDHFMFGKRVEHGRRQVKSPSRRGDFYGLREFRMGDDPRDIHWRVSARRGRYFIRESEDESSRTVIVVLEDAPDPTPASATESTTKSAPTDAAAFEAAVSMAASIAVQLCKRGFHVGLVCGGAYLPPAGGPMQASQLLQALALVQAGTARALPGSVGRNLPRVHVRPGRGGPVVESVSPGPAAAGPRKPGDARVPTA